MNSSATPIATLAWGAVAATIMTAGIGIRQSESLSQAVTDPITATWLAAISGAALGGAISYFLARQTSKETLRRDAENRLSSEHASSLRAMVTAMQISNRLYTMTVELEDAVKKRSPTGPWASLRPNTGPGSDPPDFLATDFVPFINNQKSDIVHRALMLSERTHALQAAFVAYGLKRDEFEKFAEPFTRPMGPALTMTTIFPPAAEAGAKIKIKVMNDLVEQMHQYSKEYLEDAKRLCDGMGVSSGLFRQAR